jgi:hypothetical protein
LVGTIIRNEELYDAVAELRATTDGKLFAITKYTIWFVVACFCLGFHPLWLKISM